MPTDSVRRPRLSLAVLRPLQDWLAIRLGVEPGGRKEAVVAMLTNNVRRAPGYWIQLLMATGIATLGLTLNSVAVVIGGMLVSPLMGPIVELGMGFAVGSSLLVLRAAICVALSVASVIATAAMITLALPFHEITGEIAARTSPTLLDLLIAVFCALVAAYTTVRHTSDTTAAAAGTSVGIALVPPLCVTGFGIGTADAAVSGGALLLFVANFSAIMVFAMLVFLGLGFARVDAATLEGEFGESYRGRPERIADRFHAALKQAFGSRYGLAMRFMVPAVFLLVVYVPLNRALDDVSWQFRVRRSLRQIVATESPDAVQSGVVVDRGRVSLRLMIVGTSADAARLESTLTTRLAAASGVTPTVSVIAVADANSLVTERLAVERSAPPPPADPSELRRRVAAWLPTAWPESGGSLAGWALEIGNGAVSVLAIRHLGPPVGPVAGDLLGRQISGTVGGPVRVVDVALPIEPVVAGRNEETAWLVQAAIVLERVGSTSGVVACVSGPIDATGRSGAGARAIVEALQATAAGREARLMLTAGPRWSIRVAAGACEEPAPNAGAGQ